MNDDDREQLVAAARNVAAALPGEPHQAQQRARQKRGAAAGKIDHRRRQHHAVEPALAGMRDAQHHRPAHRMRQREMRRRAIRQHHLLHEGFDVHLVIGEIADIALARIAQAPRRVALPAPVDHRHRKTAVAQVTHGLEIFFDLLARPVKTQTVPLRLAGGAQRAKRNSAPSGVVMVPETTSSGTGLAGIETSVMTGTG